jgi:diguanylate cyclase (GGDEF)-like protein
MTAQVPRPRNPAAAIARDSLEDDVLAMLEVGESDLLPGWLGARAANYMPGMRSRVLRIYPAKAARIKGLGRYEAFSVTEAKDDKPAPVGMDAPLVAAVRNRFPLSVEKIPGGLRLLAVFEAGGEVRFVLELRGKVAGGEPDSRVEALVEVARRYFERLVDGETDPLTRLASRRRFQAHVDAGIRAWTSVRRAYFFAMLDIDRFKKVNDTFGHLYGDEILVHFANLMRATFRAGDQLYRFGGEEFVLIYGVDPPENGGEGTLERFRAAVENYDFPGVGKVTVSIGFTRVTDVQTPAATLIDRADQAVYYAKAHGRNRVCSWEALVEAGELIPPKLAKSEVTLF